MSPFFRWILIWVFLFGTELVGASAVGASDAMGESSLDGSETSKNLWSFAVLWENDSLARTDRFYTNGVGLALTQTGTNGLDPLADRLPWGQGRRTVGYALSQMMMTPADTSKEIPDPHDRPYAGILSFDLSLQVERNDSYHGLKGMMGVIGPSSGAGSMQREVHRLLNRRQPAGWEHQLKDELLLNLFYEYRHRLRLGGRVETWGVEALPLVGASLGNFRTQGAVGGVLRAGYRLPRDFGPSVIRGMGLLPPPEWRAGDGAGWNFSIYSGAFVTFVLRDITLDGNTFSDSPRVEKYWVVPVAGSGIVIGNRYFRFTFSYVFWGKEFKGQKDYAKFGAIALCIFF